MTRLEKAKQIFNERVAQAKPSFANTLYEIKKNILYAIFEDIFEEKPTRKELKWWENEMDEIAVFTNTEYF